MAAYVPHNWESNEVISATLLNHIEDGIEELNDAKEGMAGKYTKPAGGIPKSDLASDVRESLGKADTAIQEADIDETVSDWLDENLPDKMSGKADKADTVLTTTLSRGRKANSTVGTGSFAFGNNVTASGTYGQAEGDRVTASGSGSHAEGLETVASGRGSHAEGASFHTIIWDSDSGQTQYDYITTASGEGSHAEGGGTISSGMQSHAEGERTESRGKNSHAEGSGTIAKHKSQHVFGEYNEEDPSTNSGTSRGTYAEIVGNGTSDSSRSNARTLDWDGNETLAGKLTLGAGPTEDMDAATKGMVDGKADKTDTVLETTLSRGRRANTTAGAGSIAFGNDVEATGEYSTATGNGNHAWGANSRAGGANSYAIGDNSEADGLGCYAVGDQSSATGRTAIATKRSQHVFGEYNEFEGSEVPTSKVSEKGQYVEIVGNGAGPNPQTYSVDRSNARTLDWNGNERLAGDVTIFAGSANEQNLSGKANKSDTVLETTLSRGRVENSSVGNGSFAFGNDVQAVGDYSHAEGDSTTSNGDNSHAEGSDCTAGGASSHAEGIGCSTAEEAAHAEGYQTIASNYAAHSEGTLTVASGDSSHAEGVRTTANHIGQHVFGINNIVDDSNTAQGTYVEIVGNGDPNNDTPKSNARTLDWNGNERLAGDVTAYAGGEDEISLIQLRNIKAPAILESASGNIVSITDGAEGLPLQRCEVTMTPEQDLHGYDAPWPAGGGKNLITQSIFEIGIIGTNGSKTAVNGSISDKTKDGEVTVTTTSSWTGIITDNFIPVAANQTYTASCDSDSGVAYVIVAYYDSNQAFINESRSLTAGNVHTSITPATAVYAKVSYQWSAAGTYTIKGIQFEVGNSASSFVPYSNICPISGWTGCNVIRSGGNILDDSQILRGVYTPEGTLSTQGDQATKYISYKQTLPKGSYTFSTDLQNCFVLRCLINNVNIAVLQTTQNIQFTLTEQAEFKISLRNTSTSDISSVTPHSLICAGSAASDYEPYTGYDVYQIEFPSAAGTVCSGSLTIHPDGPGTLVVTKKQVTISGLQWTYDSSGMYFYASPADKAYGNTNLFSDTYPVSESTTVSGMADKSIKGNAVANRIYAKDTDYSDVTTFVESMGNVAIVYELSEAVSYELTASQIKTLKGTNNIWADCGEIGIQYAADTKLYIDRKIMEAVAAALNA